MSDWSSLKIELIATGDQANVWGTTTNNNFQYAIEEAITASGNVTFASNNQTLALINSNLSQTARKLRLNLTGATGGSTRSLFVPAIQKQYIINNGCADSVLVTNGTDPTPTGTGVTVPAGKSLIVFNDGTNVSAVVNYAPSLALGSALPITSGGTGQTTATAAINALLPAQGPNPNRFLFTDGTNVSWADNPLGTVTSVSVSSVNGFSGTVATSTTTPVISLGTTVSGILKGNGVGVSTAVAGTDYLPPPATLAPGFLQWTGSVYIWNTAIGSGSVTSVTGSGGTTGMTLSGGPITTVGTLTLGGVLNVLNGGTGQSSFTNDGALYANASGTAILSGTLPVLSGGTGQSSFTNNGALYANASGTAISSGILPILSGGTGINTVTANGALYGNGTGTGILTGTLPPIAGGTGVTSPGPLGNLLTSDGIGNWTSAAPPITGPSTAKTYFMAQF